MAATTMSQKAPFLRTSSWNNFLRSAVASECINLPIVRLQHNGSAHSMCPGVMHTGMSIEFNESKTSSPASNGKIHSTSTERRLWIKYVHNIERSIFVWFVLATTAVTPSLGLALQIPLELEGVFLWLFHVLIDTRARQKFQTLLRETIKLTRLAGISRNSVWHHV